MLYLSGYSKEKIGKQVYFNGNTIIILLIMYMLPIFFVVRLQTEMSQVVVVYHVTILGVVQGS